MLIISGVRVELSIYSNLTLCMNYITIMFLKGRWAVLNIVFLEPILNTLMIVMIKEKGKEISDNNQTMEVRLEVCFILAVRSLQLAP
jgi:hypothetical protein